MDKFKECAIKGGYSWTGTKGQAEMLLDPEAWKCCGKAEGWSSGCNICLKDGITHSYSNGWADECENPKQHLTEGHKYPWQIEWHRFIDHIASGGDIDTFFTNLLSKRE